MKRIIPEMTLTINSYEASKLNHILENRREELYEMLETRKAYLDFIEDAEQEIKAIDKMLSEIRKWWFSEED